jgi:stearoyl-CoA desaturase (delta-9 desaturase)
MIFNEFTWWSVIYALITTHLTILTVTIYLHRSVAHRALSVTKPLEHFFRFWCWLTTGQIPMEWAAIHRKHHAFCETEKDPNSPKFYGIWKVLFQGYWLYKNETKNKETLEKYGKLTVI